MKWKPTGKKLLRVLGKALLVFVIVIILLAMLGTVAHASGLVDDTIDLHFLVACFLHIIFAY